MDTRRDFFKRVAALAGGTALAESLLPAIERAAAIAPANESSYLQAEHVVILMQENRSFDHCFGALRGVRGFHDPRAVILPDGNPVWLQTDAHGQTYAPFRLDAAKSNATWLGSLPHSWTDQVDAKNQGNHDGWLQAKQTRNEHALGMPLTMGHYTREDLPFYYALADAFTVCDQHFCSSLTGTTPNRLYLWTGTIREQQDSSARAHTRNEDVDFDAPARWSTFPERLQDAGVSWKIYQNELCLPSGLSEQEDAWLSNFSDNPLEWFPQFAVEYAPQHRAFLEQMKVSLPTSILQVREQLASSLAASERERLVQKLQKEEELLRRATDRLASLEGKALQNQPARTQALHRKAFATNCGDPKYRSLTSLPVTSDDGKVTEAMHVPEGDILHQFRQDAESDKLPAVSWIVAPEKFSDHPTSPWYGAWYVAEVLNILTKNPDVWKKTIFILTYDENDGFFDHVPPFAAPQEGKPETGCASRGIDTALEHVTVEQDALHAKAGHARAGSIGLGFRVPMIVASPWSRGGAVCSQVFDHTSVLQFLEEFASHRSGKPVRETNISDWRRTVCGNLSSTFQSAGERSALASTSLPYPDKTAFLSGVQQAAGQPLPHYAALTWEEIARERAGVSREHSVLPQQEMGIRPARALPYQLSAGGFFDPKQQAVVLTMTAGNEFFGTAAAGAPFHVYAPRGFQHGGDSQRVRSYAVKAGDCMQASWDLQGFGSEGYHLSVNGPNGFLCDLAGNAEDPAVIAEATWARKGLQPVLRLQLRNNSRSRQEFRIVHHAYGYEGQSQILPSRAEFTIDLPLQRSLGWYDLSVVVEGYPKYERHYAGHVETGAPSYSDPQIGSLLV